MREGHSRTANANALKLVHNWGVRRLGMLVGLKWVLGNKERLGTGDDLQTLLQGLALPVSNLGAISGPEQRRML